MGRTTLTSTTYLNLGAGPMDIETEDLGALFVHFGASQPAVDTSDRKTVTAQLPYRYPGTQNVWARAKGKDIDALTTSHA